MKSDFGAWTIRTVAALMWSALVLGSPARNFAAEQASNGEETDNELQRRIERLIGQLGDPKFNVREAAHRELLKIGTPAVRALRAAAKNPSAEVRSRAKQILERIEHELNRPALYVFTLEGKQVRRIVPDRRDQLGSPQFSPDGRKIAFDAWESSPRRYLLSHVYVSGADGSGMLDLGPGAMPSWSPDGRRLAFHRYGSEGGIWMMNADGTGQKRIHASGVSPRWSPDGWHIAFDGGREIVLYSVDEGGVRSLRPAGFSQINIGLSFSPDGRRICFTGVRQEPKKELAVIDVEGSGSEAKILHEGPLRTHTAFSPDGRDIAFFMQDRSVAAPQIYLISADGKGKPRLLKGQPRDRQNLAMSFSPDGRLIAFASHPKPKAKQP